MLNRRKREFPWDLCYLCLRSDCHDYIFKSNAKFTIFIVSGLWRKKKSHVRNEKTSILTCNHFIYIRVTSCHWTRTMVWFVTYCRWRSFKRPSHLMLYKCRRRLHTIASQIIATHYFPSSANVKLTTLRNHNKLTIWLKHSRNDWFFVCFWATNGDPLWSYNIQQW